EQPISFAELLTMVEKVDGIRRIRFMTSHPKDLSDELIEVMKNSKKICNHLHLPMQSGSTRILKEMNRKYTKEDYLRLVEKIKTAMPNISLTTDIIVGFPGETYEDFLETVDVVRKSGFDSAYTFIYSKRSGTVAAKMENQVPEELVKEWFKELLEEIKITSEIQANRYTGQTLDVLVEEENEQGEGMLTGRLSNNLLVHFYGDKSMIGTIVPVHLKECKGFYYIGELKV
ncbi:MAG: MiaB/RimO family radical SAM methylthiotransferase, partial [Treponema sp.]|nr:MiaB/RimO family radical SAM methylthiotransferase [Treponema sp.]